MAFDVYIRKSVENGKVIFPEKFVLNDDEILTVGNEKKKSIESLKRQMDTWLFSGQYQNDPVDLETVEFKPIWFKTFKMDEETVNKLRDCPSLMSVDPAFRLKQTNDYSGICVTRTSTENHVYVMEAIKKKMNPKNLVDEIFRLYTIYKPYRVLVETVAAQILLVNLLQEEMLKRNQFFTIQEVKPSTNETKAARIRGLIPHYANGRIFHREGMKELENELTEFPRSTHDDISDCLSYMIPYWKGVSVSKPQQEAPYGSLNWWKKQMPVNNRIGSLFRDFQRAR